MNTSHASRIRDELKSAGMTKHGLRKMATKELHRVLHEDEHIGGIVYGYIGGGNSAMLVATDKRIVFIDKRVMFMTTDELTYDVVSGIKTTSAGPFTSVILHTRINEYVLRYVNSKCAWIFTAFIEKKRLVQGSYDQAAGRYTPDSQLPDIKNKNIDNDTAISFLRSHELGSLSTVDRTGNVHGAMVYYVVNQNNTIYILTKSETSKGEGVYAHSQVALTVYEPDTLKTLQLQGIAEVETDKQVKEDVMELIVKPRKYKDETHLPPVVKVREGAFMIIRIHPTSMKFYDYSKDK